MNQSEHEKEKRSGTKAPDGREPGEARGRRGRSRKRKPRYLPVIIGCVCVAAVVFLAAYGLDRAGAGKADMTAVAGSSETESSSLAQTAATVTVAGIDISGMSEEEAKAAIVAAYPWSLTITYQDQDYQVPNLLEQEADRLLQTVYHGGTKTAYTMDFSSMKEAFATEVAAVAAMWDRPAKRGDIASYDASKDAFVFEGVENGVVIDQEKLMAKLQEAIEKKQFTQVIQADEKEDVANAEDNMEKQFKILATFATKTTNNNGRNINIKLASQALNGTILKPGEEFSFNGAVGQRTSKKGYHSAAAYNNGEVVQEIGGGVCQLSTTLYNATVIAGLEITGRRSHTFEPSYITPGQDATVSWPSPDFRFRNNSGASIGIRASYSDRTVTVSIYGVPILEEGVTYELQSKKLSTLAVPAPTYKEDKALAPGTERRISNGSQGSVWETRLVIKKNGEVISQNVDHKASYVGHAPVIARNTSAPVPTEPIVPPVIEPVTDPVPTEPTAPVEIGPGIGIPSAPTEGTTSPAGPQPTQPAAQPTQSAAPAQPAPTSPPTQAPVPAPAPDGAGPGSGGPGGGDVSGPG